MDRLLFYHINRDWTGPWLDFVMAVASSFDLFLPFLILAGILLLIRGGFPGRSFLVCSACVFLVNDGLVTQVLKDIIRRPRPWESMEGVRIVDLARAKPRVLAFFQDEPVTVRYSSPVFGIRAGRSYPSGHVANNFALLVLLATFFPRWGWCWIGPAILVAYSRVYTGAHWPSDVVGSAFQGMGLALLTLATLESAWRRWGLKRFPTLAQAHPSLFGREPIPQDMARQI